MKKTVFLSAASCAFLVSCSGMVGQPVPVVSSFNEASVGIQIDGLQMDMATPEVRASAIAAADAEAASICSRGPNRRAEYASSRNLPNGQYSYIIERLYLCLR